MRDFYPAIEPFETGRLAADRRHSLYWEQSGNPQGVPVLFLHGGPGSGAAPVHRRFFDPAHYRIIIFDQRGAGRSTPKAETIDNTTAHLIADIEALRVKLGVEKWILFGGSWGSTLALAYGQQHPQRCLAFVLRGVFLAHDAELDWYLHGIRAFFPEDWRRFSEFLPADERHDLLGGYCRRLDDPDPAVHLAAARAWNSYETAASTLRNPARDDPRKAAGRAGRNGTPSIALARIEAHYFRHKMFLAPGQLLDNMAVLAAVPASIVQGRYDVICPVATADALARAWPGCDLRIVAEAGHSAMEPGIRSELIAVMDDMRRTVAVPRNPG